MSLVPSATETLLAWGIIPVACTRFCDQPGITTVGGTKDPDLGAVASIGADLVVMDREENRREDHDALMGAGIAVHVVELRDVRDLDREMLRLAEVVGGSWRPVPLPAPTAARGRAWVPIWRRPWMALGTPTYGASVLARLGWEVVGDDGPYPELGPDRAASAGAGLVIVPDEPYPFGERHRAELETVAPAVFVDGRDLFWWGERTVAALARLGACLAGAGPG